MIKTVKQAKHVLNVDSNGHKK